MLARWTILELVPAFVRSGAGKAGPSGTPPRLPALGFAGIAV
jgi:hypothetical protein